MIFAFAKWCFSIFDHVYHSKFCFKCKESPEFPWIAGDCLSTLRDICGYRGMVTFELIEAECSWSDALRVHYDELLTELKLLAVDAFSISNPSSQHNSCKQDDIGEDGDELIPIIGKQEEIEEDNFDDDNSQLYHYDHSDLEYLDECRDESVS